MLQSLGSCGYQTKHSRPPSWRCCVIQTTFAALYTTPTRRLLFVFVSAFVHTIQSITPTIQSNSFYFNLSHSSSRARQHQCRPDRQSEAEIETLNRVELNCWPNEEAKTSFAPGQGAKRGRCAPSSSFLSNISTCPMNRNKSNVI